MKTPKQNPDVRFYVSFILYDNWQCRMIENERRYKWPYLYFSFLYINYKERENSLPLFCFFFIMTLANKKPKWRYELHMLLFHVSYFHLANRNGYNGSYSSFPVFVYWEKGKDTWLPFSCFMSWNRKRKTNEWDVYWPTAISVEIARWVRMRENGPLGHDFHSWCIDFLAWWQNAKRVRMLVLRELLRQHA